MLDIAAPAPVFPRCWTWKQYGSSSLEIVASYRGHRQCHLSSHVDADHIGGLVRYTCS